MIPWWGWLIIGCAVGVAIFTVITYYHIWKTWRDMI